MEALAEPTTMGLDLDTSDNGDNDMVCRDGGGSKPSMGKRG
jgi:hypothetical protein